MEIVSLEIAKKLSRRKLPKGQTKKMYQKRNNCSVYDVKPNHKNAYCAYDAPDLAELERIASCLSLWLRFVRPLDVNGYAEKLLDILRARKTYLDNVII